MLAQSLTFDALQRTLPERVTTHMPQRGTIVVLPSLSFPASELVKITAIERYEERLLYLLLHLDQPDARIVYVTSLPIDPAVVNYYLGFLPDPEAARERLALVSLGSFSGRGLANDLADDPAALQRIRAAVGDAVHQAVILPFNVTDAERRIAVELEIPLFAVHPDLVALGSKTGSRRVARAAGVPVLPGVEDLRSTTQISHAVDRLRIDHPGISAVVIKLNNGFSGQGNAMVTWDGAAADLAHRDTVFCGEGETWKSFAGKIAAEGAIVEQLLPARAASPSAQAWISPTGDVQVVSTHDQVLGGPGGQVYLGCRFPAAEDYRTQIISYTAAVGRHLADAGVVGPFAVDFSAIDGGHPQIYLSEINLRIGGTTHPFGMAKLVTGARSDAQTGLHTVDGQRVYVASDNLKDPALTRLNPNEVVASIADAGLAFDRQTRVGVTLHLLGAVRQYGKLGALCIARTPDEAEHMLVEVGRALRL